MTNKSDNNEHTQILSVGHNQLADLASALLNISLVLQSLDGLRANELRSGTRAHAKLGTDGAWWFLVLQPSDNLRSISGNEGRALGVKIMEGKKKKNPTHRTSGAKGPKLEQKACNC
jgi:hypothetical protein